MNEREARQEICRVGRNLYDRGYAHATAGNISIRLDEGFLITPSDASLGHLLPEAIARVDGAGHAVGDAQPSKSLVLHRAIYAASTAAGAPARCVIHTHSTHCVAMTLQPCSGDLLPPITPYFVMKVGHVPVIPYHHPGHPTVATLVAAAIDRHARVGTPLRAVMLSRLGPNVWHETPGKAMAVLEELEETAKLWRHSDPKPEPLTAADLADLNATFGPCW